MAALVDVPAMRRLVAQVGVPNFLQRLTDLLDIEFARWNDFSLAPRVADHWDFGVIELMPTQDGELYAFKFVNGHPRNTETGHLTVTAFGALADVATGYPTLICEMTILTALRTAATSALACKYMMKKDATTAAIIGCGAQSEFQVIALATVCGLKTVKYFDLSKGAMQKFAQNMAAYPDIKIIPASSAEEAVKDVDVITTATAAKKEGRVLEDAWIKPGVHINGIGGDCPGKTELPVEIVQRAKIGVEYTPQTRIEGEIQQLAANAPVTELWEVITGAKKIRTSDEDITLFDSVGFAIEDFAALKLVDLMLTEFNIDCQIPLVPDVKDPRDLFGALSETNNINDNQRA